MKKINVGDEFILMGDKDYVYKMVSVEYLNHNRVSINFKCIRSADGAFKIDPNYLYRGYTYAIDAIQVLTPAYRGHKLTKIFT